MNNTNTSAIDTARLLTELNRHMACTMLPAVVYVSVLMTVGLAGNCLVCFYYIYKAKTTPSTIFILSLGLYDLTVCCIFMPTEIVGFVKFYTFSSRVACRVLRFVNMFTGMGSVLTLLAIAVDRYKHIPRVARKQLSTRQAKIICLVVAGLALLLSWPSILVYDSLPIDIPNEAGVPLQGSNCMLTDEAAYRPYVWAFSAMQFLCFLAFTAALIVLYGIVGHTIYKHRQRMSKYRLSALALLQEKSVGNEDHSHSFELNDHIRSCVHNSQAGHYTRDMSPNCTAGDTLNELTKETFQNNSTLDTCNSNKLMVMDLSRDKGISQYQFVDENISDTDKECHENQAASSNSQDIVSNISISTIFNEQFEQRNTLGESNATARRRNKDDVCKSEPRRRRHLHDRTPFDSETVQVTMVMIAVTGLFVLSMLPYLCLTVWRVYEGKHEAEFLSDQGLLAFKIASRSYLLNSSLNPLIYGMFNSKFRTFYHSKLCCK